MVTPTANIAPIQRSVTVSHSPAEAFRIFTEEIARWWPVVDHSIGEERIRAIVFEPKVGGRVYEIWDDGSEHDWARLLAWEPANRFVMEWRPNPERPAPTEVEVTFTPEGAGTRVAVEHRGWERLGDQAEEVHASYAGGWQTTLERFASHAG